MPLPVAIPAATKQAASTARLAPVSAKPASAARNRATPAASTRGEPRRSATLPAGTLARVAATLPTSNAAKAASSRPSPASSTGRTRQPVGQALDQPNALAGAPRVVVSRLGSSAVGTSCGCRRRR
jgi:hypothetical protein